VLGVRLHDGLVTGGRRHGGVHHLLLELHVAPQRGGQLGDHRSALVALRRLDAVEQLLDLPVIRFQHPGDVHGVLQGNRSSVRQLPWRHGLDAQT
jgi:hypothetical protein